MPNKEQYKKLKDAGVFCTQAYKIKTREYAKKYAINNRQKIRIKNKLWYQKNKNTNSYKERKRRWKANNKDKIKSYYVKCSNNFDLLKNRKKYFKEYRKKNKKYFKEYRKKNEKYFKEYKKEWRKNNKEYKNLHQQKYRKNLRKTNLKWVLTERLRSRIWKALKGNFKTDTTKKLLSCTLEEFKIHLESKFKEGMTWDNYGLWHIDHIKPCASFDLICPVQQLACFHYKNLQPLWALENLQKSAKYETKKSISIKAT